MRVAVVGLGVLGAMSSWRLAERGAEVVMYDRFGVASDRGGSHGSTRIFRRALFEGPAYVPLIDRAADLWAELGRRHPTAGWRATGGLTIGPRAGGIVAKAIAAAHAGDVDIEMLSTDELHDRYPQHRLRADDIAMFEPGAGVIPAEASVNAAVDEATHRGGVVRADVQVHAVRGHNGAIVLDTSLGSQSFDAAVLAAGAGLGSLVPALGPALTVEQSMHVWFASKQSPTWSTESFPVFVRESGSLHGWGIGDTGDGQVKIGLGSAKPEIGDLESYLCGPPMPAPAETAPVGSYVRAALDGLDPRPIAAVACLNTFASDGDFILGPHPADPRIILAGAGSGHSFKHAPAVGDIVADLVLDGVTSTPITAFDPSRFLDADINQA